MRAHPSPDLTADGPGGWWLEGQPELHLDADADFPVVVPDLAGWRTTTLLTLPETAAYTVTPDWVCEILSRSTAADDRALKMPFYAQAGIGHLWIVDPLLFTLEVYRLDAGTWRRAGAVAGPLALAPRARAVLNGPAVVQRTITVVPPGLPPGVPP